MNFTKSLLLIASVASFAGTGLDAQEKNEEVDPKQHSQWAFEPGSWIIVKRTVEIDGKVVGTSHKKTMITKEGLQESYIGGKLNGQVIHVSRGRPYMPGGDTKFAETEMTIDDRVFKCGVIMRKDTIPGRSKLQRITDKIQEREVPENADTERRRRFQIIGSPEANIPFRQLPIQGADLALTVMTLGAQVETFIGDSDEPVSVQSFEVKSMNVLCNIGGKELTCVKEIGHSKAAQENQEFTVDVERLLSSEVLGHIVLDKRTITDGKVTRIVTEEVIDFHVAEQETK